MSKLTILHASDLHWSEKSADSLGIVLNALLDDVRRVRSESAIAPDILVFSGDLVNAGEDRASFDDAFERVIVPLAKAAGVSSSRVFMCPGNHDVSRKQVRSIGFVESGVAQRLVTSDAINEFIKRADKGEPEDLLALGRTDNYYNAHDSYFAHHTYRDRFLRIFKTNIGGRKIGVACFSSVWRASGEADDVDMRKLAIGEVVVDVAFRELQDCKYRIAVHHHPLDWLLPADQAATEARLRHGFDLSCSGHLHKAKPSYLRDPAGACVMSQSGSLYAGRKWFNGYQVIEIDLLTGDYRFNLRE